VGIVALKMGPREEFQKGIQDVIDTCMSALEDEVGWNDSLNLSTLTQALATLADALPDRDGPAAEGLRRAAAVVLSAQFSKLTADAQKGEGDSAADDSDGDDDEEDGEDEDEGEDNDEGPPPTDEGDLNPNLETVNCCDGICNPNKVFKWWGRRSAYQCVSGCDESWLCEDCYAALKADQSGEKPFSGRRYCEKDHHSFIKGPVEGWRGVKDGVMMLEGGKTLVFADFCKRIQGEMCKSAWENFWSGA
jgi:hypothetical protein